MKTACIPNDATAKEIVAIARSEQMPIWTDGYSVQICEFRPEGFHFFGAIASDMAMFRPANDEVSPTPTITATPRQLIERMAAAAEQRQQEIRGRLMGRAA